MKMQKLGLLALLLSSCSSTPARSPSSSDVDTQSVELASKLHGGQLKFRAYRDGNQVSLLGFVELKFKNCQVKVIAENESTTYNPNYNSDLKGTYVDCEADIDSDPVHETAHVQIQGDKRRFTAHVTLAKADNYSLEVKTTQAWENQHWTGSGEVTGWLNQHLGGDSLLTATIHERLSF